MADRIHEAARTLSPSECWLWAGGKCCGYGIGSVKDRSVRVHRFAYELLVGPVPKGLELDHLCRQRACYNPSHLEPVTGIENKRRGVSPSALNGTKTHCKRGHPFDASNTLLVKGGRACRACGKLKWARQRERGWRRPERDRRIGKSPLVRPYRGVVIRDGYFEARISYGGKMRWLGSFDTAEDAARAYDAEAYKLPSGTPRKPNFPLMHSEHPRSVAEA